MRPSWSSREAMSASPSSRSAPNFSSSQPVVRRSYHPAAPAQRSQWAMWVGNIPRDADHHELWRFFTQPDGNRTTRGALNNGVQSVFVVARSNCAFVNYNAEDQLAAAISRFNGLPLRSAEHAAAIGRTMSGKASKPLLCRARKEEHDLLTGVGGQRGVGLHSKWIKDKTRHWTVEAPLTVTSGDDPGHDTWDTVSNASTSSSLLREHFPQRFFMLKSYTQDDLDISLETGQWNAQQHNAEVLDRAFRTSEEVILFFSVNKSGEFYGYGRMTGPITLRTPHIHTTGSDVPVVTYSSTHELPPPETFLPPALLEEIEGDPEYDFPLHWICVDRLPFSRTKRIHNPWNQDREVKISRDGTEIEPESGRAVLEAWRNQRASLLQASHLRV